MFWGFVGCVVVCLFLFKIFHFSGGKCKKEYLKNLRGKTILVTGGTSGLGLEYCKQCVKNGVGKLIVCARNKTKGEKTIVVLKRMKAAYRKKTILESRCVDLGSFKSIESFATRLNEDISKGLNIDVYCLNAGCLRLFPDLTDDGLEIMFGVNHIGHFYLIKLLEKNILRFPKHLNGRRVIVVSSQEAFMGKEGQKRLDLRISRLFNLQKNLDGMFKYGRSKLANILYAQELQKRFNRNVRGGKKLICCSLHPGPVLSTQLGQTKAPWWWTFFVTIARYSFGYFIMKNVFEGIQTHLFLSCCPISSLKGGKYYSDCDIGKTDDFVDNPKNAKELWKVSEVIIQKVKKMQLQRKPVKN